MFSDPVAGLDFFGREDTLEVLRKRIDAFKNDYRQNIALIGHRELGKTSILHHFLYSYRDANPLPIYVELKPQALDHFIDQFIRSLLFQFLRRRTVVAQTESLAVLAEMAKREIPRTADAVQEIMDLLEKGDKGAAYAAVFELTTRLHQETGLKCVVILDEFHRLGDFAVKNAFQSFGRRIMFQKDTLYVISSSSFTASKRILAEKLALLFGNFERIYLKPFTFEVSSLFIEKKLEPVRVGGDLKKYLIAFTDGHPFFLNVIARELKEVADARGEESLTREVLVEAFRRLFFDAEGVLNQYFLSWILPWTQVAARGSHLSILVGLANGRNKLTDLARHIRRSAVETSRQLKELMADELIVRNGSFYLFHNLIFRFWLKYVYQTKEMSLLVHMHAKLEEFIQGCEHEIEAFLEESGSSVEQRIMNLLGSFRNEMVEFESKGRKLPRFSEIREMDGREAPKSIIAREGNLSWLCQVAEKPMAERDVLDFVRESRRLRNPRLKRILFSTRGLEPNAKLLAKNQNIWTLNLEKINTLMDFYGKAKIVEFSPSR